MPLSARSSFYRYGRPQRFHALSYSLQGGDSIQSKFTERQAIFIHIPKTGGTSVANAIFGTSIGGHVPVSHYEMVMTECQFSCFKFCFVRNPWDRLVSAYEFLRGGGLSQADKQWFENRIGEQSFDDFVMHYLSKKTVWSSIVLAPQYHWIVSGPFGRTRVDFVGRFENIRSDFQEVMSNLGFDVCLPHENKAASRDDYRKYYKDSTIEKVARIYRRDIEHFGYSF